MHVLRIAQTAFDESDIAAAEGLDVGQRRAVELHDFQKLQQALVDVEQRHVAAKAARQRDGGHLVLARGVQRRCAAFQGIHVASSCDTGWCQSDAGRWVTQSRGAWAGWPHRADIGRAVARRRGAVAQQLAAGAVDDQAGRDAVAVDGKHVLAILVALARTHRPHRMQRFRSSSTRDGWHRPDGWGRTPRNAALHAHLVRRGLQQAIPAFFARRTKVVALDEQHLQQCLALRVEFVGVALHLLTGGGLTVHAAPLRPLTLTVHRRQEPCAAKSGCQHRCGM